MAVQIDMQGPQGECNEGTDDNEVKKNTSNSNVGLALWLLHTTHVRFTAVLRIGHFCSKWRLDREGMNHRDKASVDPLPPVELRCSLERPTLVSGPEAEAT